jgi:hypothetical protein
MVRLNRWLDPCPLETLRLNCWSLRPHLSRLGCWPALQVKRCPLQLFRLDCYPLATHLLRLGCAALRVDR